MIKRIIIPVIILLSFLAAGLNSAMGTVSYAKNVRIVENFDWNWKFFKGNVVGAEKVNFDDSGWRSLNLPHDWGIEGPFSKENPTGRGEGYLPAGMGWYRKHFKLPETYRGKVMAIEFDGVYMNSDVWLNGKHLGLHPYGYTSFFYDLNPYLKFGNEQNVLAVRVDNSKQPNCRWYSGSGIYRHVRLVVTDKIHVAHWGTFVSTPKVSKKSAVIQIRTKVKNENSERKKCIVISQIANSRGDIIKTTKSSHSIDGKGEYEFKQKTKVKHPNLWSPDNPYLYKLHTIVKVEKKVVDNYETPFGIRRFHFDANKGFFLNGKNIKIKGTCNHHDLGPLGAAINDRAIERQVQILKSMGSNAIRTSHNPPAPELLNACDKYGLLVMDEAFDEWQVPKRKYGYHIYFKDWNLKDLKSMILRDRNHPSIILWSVGNEIREEGTLEGAKILKKFVQLVHSLDDTRPVTEACNKMPKANNYGFADLLDVVGYNYRQKMYDIDHKKYPKREMFASEDASALETRGIYYMPADSLIYRTPDKYCSSYDNSWVPWGESAEDSWRQVVKRPFMAGEFIWTGFDYIGEPTPYPWPAKSSYFGVIDLCGFPKDAYYFYQSQWTKKPMLHILPHWNWPGREGQKIPVWAYTNCDSVELFLNGKSLGTKDFSAPYQFHLSWDVPYAPGELRAIGKKAGKVVCKQVIHTSGLPARIVMTADRDTIRADGRDLSYITVKIVDKNGYFVPTASNLVTFQVKGEGRIVGVGNGDELSQESFKANYRRAFNGLCLAIVQSDKTAGEIVITAMSPGLKSGKIVINTSK